MSSHPNAAIAARYYEECANDYGDPDKTRAVEGVDELLAPDFVMHYNGDRDDAAMRGIDRHKQFHDPLPDLARLWDLFDREVECADCSPEVLPTPKWR